MLRMALADICCDPASNNKQTEQSWRDDRPLSIEDNNKGANRE